MDKASINSKEVRLLRFWIVFFITLFGIYEYKLKEPKTGTDLYKNVWRDE